jgi:hypothetical protein
LLDRNEALARALETIEETSRALDAARSDSAALREQRDVVTSRVDAMIASPSWKLTKPVRVVQKRLRKPSKHP